MGEGKCHFLKQPKLKATSALLYVERSQGELQYLLGLLHGREAKPFCLDSQLFHFELWGAFSSAGGEGLTGVCASCKPPHLLSKRWTARLVPFGASTDEAHCSWGRSNEP